MTHDDDVQQRETFRAMAMFDHSL